MLVTCVRTNTRRLKRPEHKKQRCKSVKTKEVCIRTRKLNQIIAVITSIGRVLGGL